MTHELIAQAIFAALAFAFTVFVFARWVPWVGRSLALYGLHGLRDQFYGAALDYPSARSTRIYRDLELSFCFLIKTVREAPYAATLDVHLRLGEPAPDAQTALRRIYALERDEAFKGEDGQRALDLMVSTSNNARRFVALYAYLGHPIMQVVGVGLAFYYAVTSPARWMSASRFSLDALSTQIAAVGSAPSQSNVAFGRLLSSRFRKRAA